MDFEFLADVQEHDSIAADSAEQDIASVETPLIDLGPMPQSPVRVWEYWAIVGVVGLTVVMLFHGGFRESNREAMLDFLDREYCRAQRAFRDGDYRTAIRAYSSAIYWEDVLRLDAYFSRGQAYFAAGQFEEAAADYTLVLKHAPRHQGARFKRAKARDQLGDLSGAKEDLDFIDQHGEPWPDYDSIPSCESYRAWM